MGSSRYAGLCTAQCAACGVAIEFILSCQSSRRHTCTNYSAGERGFLGYARSKRPRHPSHTRQVLGRDISSPAAAFGSSTRTAFQRTYASAEADRCKDSLGKQVLSEKTSAPSYGVGTEQRKGLAVKNGVPGPGLYKIKQAIGPQIESYKDNTAKPVFGSGSREQREKVYQDAESEKTYFGRLSPGPCAYESQSGSGKQVLSGMRTNQATTLGYGKRFNYDFVKRAREQPGAGEYVKNSNACGKQPLSIKKSMPLYSFGTSDRDQAAKMFLSKDHEKGQKGNLSPGPTTAEQNSAAGKQVLSKKKTQPRCSFGNAVRFGKNYYSTACSPGPATYAA